MAQRKKIHSRGSDMPYSLRNNYMFGCLNVSWTLQKRFLLVEATLLQTHLVLIAVFTQFLHAGAICCKWLDDAHVKNSLHLLNMKWICFPCNNKQSPFNGPNQNFSRLNLQNDPSLWIIEEYFEISHNKRRSREGLLIFWLMSRIQFWLMSTGSQG